MLVRKSDSTVTDMEIDDNSNGYLPLTEGGSRLQHSVSMLRRRPVSALAVFLGILCFFFLVGLIGQAVHYHKVKRNQEENYNVVTKAKDQLQQSLKTVQEENKEQHDNQGRMMDNYNYLAKLRDQIQTNNNILTRERDSLKVSQSKLQTSNTALTKERDQCKANQSQLQINNAALTKARDLLQSRYDSVVEKRDRLQKVNVAVTNERDRLQNQYNNLTRAREQLQLNHNDVVKELEELQISYNYSTSEKDKLSGRHDNVTLERDTLKANLVSLTRATHLLDSSYSAVIKERDELKVINGNLTAESGLLKAQNKNLTAQRDMLLSEVRTLNSSIPGKVCPPSWVKFQQSCYFFSIATKTWNQSRAECRTQGADLAIITSLGEMKFVNSLRGKDAEVWIGLSTNNGRWTWVDGTPLTTAYWATGQPNNQDGKVQDCVEFWHSGSGPGSWNDEMCSIKTYWICEK